ncbi:MAG: hypothetical protein IPG63_17560 [Xanthomonadales bacterium]|nr:hypothetical protein [Xanthomonadales bacterium]
MPPNWVTDRCAPAWPVPKRRVERPLLRAEFARDPSVYNDLHLEMRPLPATTENSFLLRLPVAAADAIELDDGRVFDLEALARDAARLPLAGIGLPGRNCNVRRTPAHPPTASTFWCLAMATPQRKPATFATHAQNLYDAMFNVSPYEDYANLVNWTAGFVTSNQSGADHPPYRAGCGTLACCADSAASTDPFASQFSDTALDARFCTSNIHRLLTTSSSKTPAATAAYANWDHILVTVNDSVYGGAGGG